MSISFILIRVYYIIYYIISTQNKTLFYQFFFCNLRNAKTDYLCGLFDIDASMRESYTNRAPSRASIVGRTRRFVG